MNELLLSNISRDWQEFLNSFNDLSDGSLSQAGAVGTWSIRDIMGHITTWEEEGLKYLPLILDGKTTPSYDQYGGIDTFNKQQVTKKRELSLRQIKQNLNTTHQLLLDRLSGIPDDAINSLFEKWFGEATWGHYRQHAEQIQIWRKKQ